MLNMFESDNKCLTIIESNFVIEQIFKKYIYKRYNYKYTNSIYSTKTKEFYNTECEHLILKNF